MAGALIATDDAKVLRALLNAAAAVDGKPEPTEYVVGVTNDSGHVYRLITLFGPSERARFEREMSMIGFETDLTLRSSAHSRLDDVFTRREATIPEPNGRSGH